MHLPRLLCARVESLGSAVEASHTSHTEQRRQTLRKRVCLPPVEEMVRGADLRASVRVGQPCSRCCHDPSHLEHEAVGWVLRALLHHQLLEDVACEVVA